MTCDPDLTDPIAKFFGCGTQSILDKVFGSKPEQQLNAVEGLMIFFGMIIVASFYLMWRDAKIKNEPFWLDLNNPSNWIGNLYSAPPPILAIFSGIWALSEWFVKRTDLVWGKYWSIWYGIIPILICIFWAVLTLVIRHEAKKEAKRLGIK